MTRPIMKISFRWIFLLSAVFFLLISPSGLVAQEVIATDGDHFSNSGGSISYTIGEPVTETYTGTSTILTQGFQQSTLVVTAIFEPGGINCEITAYPNPVSDFVTVNVSDIETPGMQYLLYDLNGKLLMKEPVRDSETFIPFDNVSAGEYILKINIKNLEIKSFKIVKPH